MPLPLFLFLPLLPSPLLLNRNLQVSVWFPREYLKLFAIFFSEFFLFLFFIGRRGQEKEMDEMAAFCSRGNRIWPWKLADIQKTRQGDHASELNFVLHNYICFSISRQDLGLLLLLFLCRISLGFSRAFLTHFPIPETGKWLVA